MRASSESQQQTENGHTEWIEIYRSARLILRNACLRDSSLLYRWQHDGSVPHAWLSTTPISTFDQYEANLALVLRGSVTTIIAEADGDSDLGLLQAHSINPRDGWCSICLYLDPLHREWHIGAEALIGFLDFLLGRLPLRKIYLDLFEPNLAWLGELFLSGLAKEGRQREHAWHKDRYWDLLRLALFREDWPDLRRKVALNLDVGQILASSGSAGRAS